jgi:hypothetical protein
MRLALLSATSMVAFVSGAAGATSWTVDLASGHINGHRVLGRTVSGVTAALGRPDFRAGRPGAYGYVIG